MRPGRYQRRVVKSIVVPVAHQQHIPYVPQPTVPQTAKVVPDCISHRLSGKRWEHAPWDMAERHKTGHNPLIVPVLGQRLGARYPGIWNYADPLRARVGFDTDCLGRGGKQWPEAGADTVDNDAGRVNSRLNRHG